MSSRPVLEVFGTRDCHVTAELRQELERQGRGFVEHLVDEDPVALERMLDLTGGQRMVPVLVEDGTVVEIGWQGRGCYAPSVEGGSP